MDDPENKVFTCVQKLIDIILLSRKATPLDEISRLYNCAEYVKSCTKIWRSNVFSTLCLEIFSRNSPDVLLEKWSFHCLRIGGDVLSGRSTLGRRIGIIIRTLYCHVRLLPAFHISLDSTNSLQFRISCYLGDSLSSPGYENYRYPNIPVPYVGQLTVNVDYLNTRVLQEAALNNPSLSPLVGSLIATGINSNQLAKYAGSQPVPIPITGDSGEDYVRNRSASADAHSSVGGGKAIGSSTSNSRAPKYPPPPVPPQQLQIQKQQQLQYQQQQYYHNQQQQQQQQQQQLYHPNSYTPSSGQQRPSSNTYTLAATNVNQYSHSPPVPQPLSRQVCVSNPLALR